MLNMVEEELVDECVVTFTFTLRSVISHKKKPTIYIDSRLISYG